MPELPEVETVKRTLRELVIGQTIEQVTVSLERIVQLPDPGLFAALLAGQTFRAVERRGKFLRFVLDDHVLVSHLRMEGRYGLFKREDEKEKHTHVIFAFKSGYELRYKDVRQFGTMHLYPQGQDLLQAPLCKLGIEPLDDGFTPAVLREKLVRRRSRIKPLLLNQELIVGLGNIYVDESLFRAGIHPERDPQTLDETEWERLHQAIIATLQEAVDAGGSSIKSYVNGQGEMGMFQQRLDVYGRGGKPCHRCSHTIERMVVIGRGTHLCPNCQPRGNE